MVLPTTSSGTSISSTPVSFFSSACTGSSRAFFSACGMPRRSSSLRPASQASPQSVVNIVTGNAFVACWSAYGSGPVPARSPSFLRSTAFASAGGALSV